MSSDGMYTYTCENCGNDVRRIGTDPPTECPCCGHTGWQVFIEVTEEVPPPLEEFEGTAINPQGVVVAERVEKTDGITKASLAADAGEPARIAVERKKRIRGFVDEGRAVDSLVAGFNKANGTHYVVEEKTEEDSDYADRVLVSSTDAPARINVQVRNLDAGIIAALGRQGKFDGNRTPGELIDLVCEAITVKAQVDPAIKPKTILLLAVPAAFGQVMRQDLAQQEFDFQGFRAVWLSTIHEDALPLRSA
jgi:hypothetical protein